jgi:dihydroorotate dehydrogenase (NAD+) catalytic subunit
MPESAVQIGTTNFYHPPVSVRIVDALPAALPKLGYESVREAVGDMHC